MNSLSISDDPLDTYLWESVLEVGLERTLKNSSPSPYKIYLGELFFTRLHFSKHKAWLCADFLTLNRFKVRIQSCHKILLAKLCDSSGIPNQDS